MEGPEFEPVGVGLLRVTIVCSDPCEGFPCFDCDMIVEAISMAVGGTLEEKRVEFRHQSVEEARHSWKNSNFDDLEAPYLMLGDEVKLNGREWRAAGLDSVVGIISEARTRL